MAIPSPFVSETANYYLVNIALHIVTSKCCALMQVHIFCRFVPFAIGWETALGDSGRDITDHFFLEFHCPEQCPVFWALG